MHSGSHGSQLPLCSFSQERTPHRNARARQPDLGHGTRSGPRKGVGSGGLRRGLHCPGMTVQVLWLGQVPW